jgi:hypothetical protein
MDQPDTLLSEQARTILQLIAAGRSYDQILLHHPELTYGDIFAAAAEALASLPAPTRNVPATEPSQSARHLATPDTAPPGEPPTARAENPPSEAVPLKPLSPFIERARQTRHRAWADWTSDDDAQLVRLFRRGAHLAEIGQALGRHNGAIRNRLVKLGLAAEDYDAPELLLTPADAPSPSPAERPEAPPPPRASPTWEGGWESIRRRLESGQPDE